MTARNCGIMLVIMAAAACQAQPSRGANAATQTVTQDPHGPTEADQPASGNPGEQAGRFHADQRNAHSPKPSSGNEEVDAILDRLEAKGKAIKGLGCKLIYHYVTVDPVESRQIKEGTLLFARGEPNPKFLIHFSKMIADGVVSRHGEYYLFDGMWLVVRNDKVKTVERRQIARKGEYQDPFKLGKGPFPLPFGQKREEILRQFTVSLTQPKQGDPPHSKHLHCTPQPGSELAKKYTRVEIYVDQKLDLPIRIVSERRSDGNRIEVDFKEIDVNRAPAGSRFQLQIPADFDVTQEPLPPKSAMNKTQTSGGLSFGKQD